jgi:hypothetical protein
MDSVNNQPTELLVQCAKAKAREPVVISDALRRALEEQIVQSNKTVLKSMLLLNKLDSDLA